MRYWLTLGALAAGASVALGAWAAHGLAADPMAQDWVEKAARYQMYHGLALLAVAWLAERSPSRLPHMAGAAFTVGIVLFPGALYGLAAGLNTAMLAPFGGGAFMLGWGIMAVCGLKRISRS